MLGSGLSIKRRAASLTVCDSRCLLLRAGYAVLIRLCSNEAKRPFSPSCDCLGSPVIIFQCSEKNLRSLCVCGMRWPKTAGELYHAFVHLATDTAYLNSAWCGCWLSVDSSEPATARSLGSRRSETLFEKQFLYRVAAARKPVDRRVHGSSDWTWFSPLGIAGGQRPTSLIRLDQRFVLVVSMQTSHRRSVWTFALMIGALCLGIIDVIQIATSVGSIFTGEATYRPVRAVYRHPTKNETLSTEGFDMLRVVN